MAHILKFGKGEFITQIYTPKCFAIFEGIPFNSEDEEEGVDYSLSCYYNPNHYEQNSEGKWIHENVFEYDLTGEETCDYTINENDMSCWRSCTQDEVINALKTLASKGLAWVEETNSFRRLAAGEQLKFNTSKPTGATSSTTPRTSPLYNPASPSSSKKITRTINENWEQKEPITSMDNERRVFMLGQCDKLKYAFDTYKGGTVVIYPNNGYDYPKQYGRGMEAYNRLMHGETWGCYDEYCD